ncbi:MAG: hypothetical protein ACQCXQ_12745, partial [Verrucomicrobiales bacterium]
MHHFSNQLSPSLPIHPWFTPPVGTHRRGVRQKPSRTADFSPPQSPSAPNPSPIRKIRKIRGFLHLLALLLLFTPFLHAAPALHLQDQSFFTDRVATATAYFPEEIPAVDDWSQPGGNCNLLEIDTQAIENDTRGKTLAVIRFLPTKTGPLTLPAFEFTSGETTCQTAPAQILVREPIRSSDMSLTFTPAKTRVYQGEPVRLDLRWSCSLDASKLRALQLYPDFFNNPGIEVVIPRSTDPEDQQVGLPIGGRRSIARRTRAGEKHQLGTIDQTLFLRFTTPGTHTLPAVRLECARMAAAEDEFARYAAHFNNGLFEPVTTGKLYDRVFTLSEPMTFEVLPLPPETQNTNFSGLFSPIEITAAIQPTEAMIGELMELEINVTGNAPHGMIELPKLSKQPGLRERFIVDDDASLAWHPAGTIFRTRLRALTTSIKALPALHFPVFDPETGTLTTLTTDPIPLTLTPNDGKDFLTLRSFKGAAVPLTNSPEGIWHNETSNPMNDH